MREAAGPGARDRCGTGHTGWGSMLGWVPPLCACVRLRQNPLIQHPPPAAREEVRELCSLRGHGTPQVPLNNTPGIDFPFHPAPMNTRTHAHILSPFASPPRAQPAPAGPPPPCGWCMWWTRRPWPRASTATWPASPASTRPTCRGPTGPTRASRATPAWLWRLGERVRDMGAGEGTIKGRRVCKCACEGCTVWPASGTGTRVHARPAALTAVPRPLGPLPHGA